VTFRYYYAARNPVVQSNKIDVHGLRPREAFDRIERAIVKANQEKRSQVFVIVGKGLHSVNQQPTLKPAVLREMQRYVSLVSPNIHKTNSEQKKNLQAGYQMRSEYPEPRTTYHYFAGHLYVLASYPQSSLVC